MPVIFQTSPKSQKTLHLSEIVEGLLNAYQKNASEQEKIVGKETLKVSEVLGSVAFLYERIRNALDYKVEHLLRRNAIERILRRQIWENSVRETKTMSLNLIKELIWARYLKNDKVPIEKVAEVAKILDKYLLFLNTKPEATIRDWLIGVSSCEIEEALTYPIKTKAFTEAMYRWFKENYQWESSLSEEEKDIQIFLAVSRALPKADDAMLRYYLLNIYYPDWKNSSDFPNIYRKVEAQLNHPVKFPLFRFVRKLTAPFVILREIMDENPSKGEEIFANRLGLARKIEEVSQEKYSQIRQKVNRGIVRSVIYIFITKVLIAFLIEVPYELFWVRNLKIIPLTINALIPPSLMYLVGLTIKPPSEKNTEKIIQEIITIVYPESRSEKKSFDLKSSQRKSFLSSSFLFIYGTLSLLIFGLIIYFLFKLKFNLISMAIFFIFLSLVLLFGFRIRFTASEILVTGEKEGFLASLFDHLSLPFLKLGVWLSYGLSHLNMFLIIMDFLIEAPLKNIIGIFEEWTSFLREKKKEVVEIPIQSQ